MKLEAVIWDMDGVLLDSAPSHFAAWRQILSKYDIDYREERLHFTFGMTNQQVIQYMADGSLSGDLVEKIGIEKDSLFQEIIRKNAIFLPGIQYWLDTFQRNSIKQALASSGSPGNIDSVLNTLGAKTFFKEIVSGDGMPSKPDPFVFLAAADRLGVEPNSCLVVEDAVAGVQAAKVAGMKCIGVTTTNSAEKLSDADIILENLTELRFNQIHKLFLS